MSEIQLSHVEAIATDEGALSRAQKIATPRKWEGLGRDAQTIWGLYKGSGAVPYQCQVSTQGLQYHCTCPSRVFPCKHVLALMLLAAEDIQRFEETSRPDWIRSWTPKASASSNDLPKAVDPAARQKRLEERMSHILEGAKDLKRWLGDAIRNGTAELYQEEEPYWDHWRARMIDAKAPGLANRIEGIRDLFRREDWPEQTLDALGELYLLLKGFDRFPRLSHPLQEELITQIGISTKKAEILTQAGIYDRWLVLGRALEIGERIDVSRTWLRGTNSGKIALLLDFAVGQRSFTHIWIPGTSFDAELVYYPGSFPLRAEFKSGPAQTDVLTPEIDAIPQWEQGLWQFAEALGSNPFLGQFPMLLQQLTPMQHQQHWGLADQSQHWVPLHQRFHKTWELVSLSGGQPLTLFGEWDGKGFLPLGVKHQDRWIGV